MDIISKTLGTMATARAKSDSVLVAFSGGKDSWVTLDLCSRAFDKVHLFTMFLVPGLRTMQTYIDKACVRYKIPPERVHAIPHWVTIDSLRTGMLCEQDHTLPEYTLRDAYNAGVFMSGCKVIATGAKKSDGMWRRRYFHLTRSWEDMLYPVQEWSSRDVLGFLVGRGFKNEDFAPDMGIHPAGILWLYDNARDDYDRVKEWFPYIEAVVKRREFYGITAENFKQKQTEKAADRERAKLVAFGSTSRQG